MSKGKKIMLIVLIPVLLAALVVAGLFIMRRIEIKNAPDPAGFAEKYSSEIFEAVKTGEQPEALAEKSDGDFGAMQIENLPRSEYGKLLYDYCLSGISYKLDGEIVREGIEAQQKISLSFPTIDGISEGMNENINAGLAEAVANANRREEVYDEENNFKPEIVENIFAEQLNSCLNQGETAEKSTEFTMMLKYSKDQWNITNKDEVRNGFLSWAEGMDFDAEAEKIKADAVSELTYIPFRYAIEETALSAPAPDQSKFLVTEDAAEIEARLQTDEAKKLIGDRELLFSTDIERIPGSPIHFYLDETILAISWQQVEAKAVGTYSEVIIADGSQLRRRIGGDEYESFDHKETSTFAQECNAVLTLGGDFYHHDRNCGIVVYNREIYRFDPDTCDTCYITSDGDMLFSYRGQFTTQEEAQAFVDENDVLFSLAFGPVLIDDGKDVCPDSYQWGEINDHYARSALGMLGDKHYVALNINCQQPGYYYLATLRDAADAMLRAGCEKAYTLDGGQTATTVFNTELINPVQFGWEKPISDVIYFGTAVPEK